MVDQRANLDYGRDDDRDTNTASEVEGEGFTMTDADDIIPGTVAGVAEDDVEDDDLEDEEANPEAETYGAP